MINLIILLALIAFGIYLTIKYDMYDRGNAHIAGFFIIIFTSVFLGVHLIVWIKAPYEYGAWIKKRDAFELSLKNARESGDSIEKAAVVKDISKWNEELAEKQYLNSIWICDQYYDDRYDTLKPIK